MEISVNPVTSDPGELSEWPREFNRLIPKARFLFGNDIAFYMESASEKHVKLVTLHKAIKQRGQSTPEENVELAKLTSWFFDEATNCFKRFGDYLDFSTWKSDAVRRALSA